MTRFSSRILALAVLTLLGASGCGTGDQEASDETGPKYLAEGAAAWPNALITDGPDLYFTDYFSSLVHRVPKSGGPASRLYGSADDSLRGTGLAHDAANVYAAFFEGTVVKIPRDGSAPIVLASDQRDVSSVAVHEGRVYWVVGYIPNVAGGPAIMTLSSEGGDPSVFASRQVGAESLLVHGNDLYWVAGGSVMTAPATGGEPRKLVSDTLGQTSTLTIHGHEIFWPVRGAVGKAPLAGGAAELLSYGSDSFAQSDYIAADDTFVYVSDAQARTVSRIPRTGGLSEIVSPHDALAGGIVVDADAVYYADGATESVVRLPKE